MPSCCVIELEVGDDAYELEVSGGSRIDFDSGEYIAVHSTEYPDYEGPYEAFPRFSEQGFETSERVMHDDFTVHAIKYTEAPNDSGITVTIGG